MFIRRVTARPNECLIVVKNRKLINLGNGASQVLYPWDSFFIIPTSTIETDFQMQQQSEDGITLRFKGIVIYRVTDPEKASLLFDFSTLLGVDAISKAIRDLCLGELRAIVSEMTLDECIKQRKTTLTSVVRESISPIIEGGGANKEPGWGITLDVVQVAQVFVDDKEIFEAMQAETRDNFRRQDQLSKISTQRELDIAKMEADKERSLKEFNLEKEGLDRKKETLRMSQALEEERINAEAELKKLEVAKKLEAAEKELELKGEDSRIKEIELQDMIKKEKALAEIRRENLKVEQLPQIAAGLSGLFKDSRLSFYGEKNEMVSSITKILDLLTDELRGVK